MLPPPFDNPRIHLETPTLLGHWKKHPPALPSRDKVNLSLLARQPLIRQPPFTMKSVASLSAAAALLAGSADAFWRMPCHSRNTLARLDPIVDKGIASSHAHVIHGGNSTYNSSSRRHVVAPLCPSA